MLSRAVSQVSGGCSREAQFLSKFLGFVPKITAPIPGPFFLPKIPFLLFRRTKKNSAPVPCTVSKKSATKYFECFQVSRVSLNFV